MDHVIFERSSPFSAAFQGNIYAEAGGNLPLFRELFEVLPLVEFLHLALLERTPLVFLGQFYRAHSFPGFEVE